MPSADLGLSRGGKGESEMADVMIGILRLMFQGDGQGSIIAAGQGFLKNKHRRAIGGLHVTVPAQPVLESGLRALATG